MEILIKCPGCKSKYSFHEEPVSGRLRFPVSCTNCGADGTGQANEFIRKFLSGELEQERQRNSVWWRRIFRKEEDDDWAPSAGSPESARRKASNTALGIVGACVGGFAGMMLWYGVTAWSGWEIGYVAWAVGILAGLGARLFVPNGNFKMASVAAICAFLAIMIGQVLVMRTWVDDLTKELFKGAYSRAFNYAKAATKVVTDDDIRALLKKHPEALLILRDTGDAQQTPERKVRRLAFCFMDSGEDSEDGLSEVSIDDEPLADSEILRFRREEMPLLVAFAGGKPTRAEFEKTLRSELTGEQSLQETVMQSWSPYQLLWLFLGVGSAYKLAYNKSETEDV